MAHCHTRGTGTIIVMPFVLEADRDTVVMEGPEFLDQPVVVLLRPFTPRNPMMLARPWKNSERFRQRLSSV